MSERDPFNVELDQLRERVERLAAENSFLRAQFRPRIRFIGSGAMRQSGDNLQRQISPGEYKERLACRA